MSGGPKPRKINRAGVTRFLEDLAEDTEALRHLVGLAAEKGYEITARDLAQHLLVGASAAMDELSEQELDKVAGGKKKPAKKKDLKVTP
jgi:predicted ribosomally synthesized peptide with nif11-like leader